MSDQSNQDLQRHESNELEKKNTRNQGVNSTGENIDMLIDYEGSCFTLILKIKLHF